MYEKRLKKTAKNTNKNIFQDDLKMIFVIFDSMILF
jgi:hypothetical protein